MKLVQSKVELIEQGNSIEDIYRHIELCGRVCYKSEDKITEESAKEFVDRMIKSGHGAMLEHGTVYLDMPNSAGNYNLVPFFASNSYSKVVIKPLNDRVHNYITTNFREIVENFAEEYIPDVLQYICEPTEYHEKRITVKWTCDRVTGESFLRHRVFSFARESTRYCNYSKDKFGNELTFIIPSWLDIPEGQYTYWDGDWCDTNKMKIQLAEGEHEDIDTFLWVLENADLQYKSLLNKGWKPQQARQVLPFCVKSPLIMTGFESDWPHFFDLRCAKSAHPDAQKLANELKELMYGSKEV